jgi:methylglutaconyl-CoA hydratase
MSSKYESILVVGEPAVTITLNRPDIHNPFDERMIAELTDCLLKIAKDGKARALVITGAGKSFCAGADLNWMKRMGRYSRADNIADAGKLAAMFSALEAIEVPTIAKVNGAALGGGAGLVCACDFAIANVKAKIGFSEVKLGLLPGVISPYVIDRVGGKRAAQLFMTGERLDAEMARRLGLFDDITEPDDLDTVVGNLLTLILTGGPEAVKACKRLARAGTRMPRDDFRKYCITAIAEARASAEGKEGVSAFLEKREPAWRK